MYLVALSLTACDSEDLQTTISETETKVKEQESDSELEPEVSIEINTTPCAFTLNNLTEGEILDIDCQIDLKGSTIKLPSKITLNFTGGEIINGTLIFSEGTIDGKLLNHTLNINGTGKLNSSIFLFYPKRWNIIQGKTSKNLALKNKFNLQKAIDQVKAFELIDSKNPRQIFTINKLDAYFELAGEWVDEKKYSNKAIHLPSDFHFKMSKSTFLRVQPNFWPRGVLLSVYEQKNTLVSGGNLIGDRYTHNYAPIKDELGIARDTHEWPVLLSIAGCKDVIFEKIYMTDSTGDACVTGATNGSRDIGGADKKFNQNVIIRGCVMNASRRNNISITDGEDIFITNCIIQNGGNGDTVKDASGNKIVTSAGTAPRAGIDIEPFRGYNPDGSFRNFEIVKRVTISGCTFKNNRVASIIDYSGINTTIKNNTSDHGFFASFSTGTKFLYNTFKASAINKDKVAIVTGNWIINNTQLSKNNEVTGNKIEGFRVGITTQGDEGNVSNNTITDFEYGIQVKNSTRFTYVDNKMISNQRNAIGIAIANTFAEDLVFKKLNITVLRKPIEVFVVNNKNNFKKFKIIFTGKSIFKSIEGRDIFIKDTPNVEISNSTLINTDITTNNVFNLIDRGNTKI